MNVFLNPSNSYDANPDACYTPPAQQAAPNISSWNGPSYSNESNLAYNNYNPDGSSSGSSIARISAPADTVLVFEAYVEDGDSNNPYVGLSPRQGDYMQVPGFFPNQPDAVSSWGYPLQSATNPWHKSVSNYLFNDGHVKSRRPEKQTYNIQMDPNNIWLINGGRDGSPVPAPQAGGC